MPHVICTAAFQQAPAYLQGQTNQGVQKSGICLLCYYHTRTVANIAVLLIYGSNAPLYTVVVMY